MALFISMTAISAILVGSWLFPAPGWLVVCAVALATVSVVGVLFYLKFAASSSSSREIYKSVFSIFLFWVFAGIQASLFVTYRNSVEIPALSLAKIASLLLLAALVWRYGRELLWGSNKRDAENVAFFGGVLYLLDALFSLSVAHWVQAEFGVLDTIGFLLAAMAAAVTVAIPLCFGVSLRDQGIL